MNKIPKESLCKMFSSYLIDKSIKKSRDTATFNNPIQISPQSQRITERIIKVRGTSIIYDPLSSPSLENVKKNLLCH